MDYSFATETCGFCTGLLTPTDITRSDGIQLLVCEQCGAGRVAHAPDGLVSLYEHDYFDRGAGTLIGYEGYGAADTAALLWAKHLVVSLGVRPPSTLLDVGCADGGLLGLFNDDFGKAGIEPNRSAAQAAMRRGVDLLASDVNDLDPRVRFDAVFALALLEHLPDPLQTALKLTHALNAGGLVLFEIPSWQGGSNDVWLGTSLEHLWYPTPASLRALLQCSPLDWWHVLDVEVSGFGHTCIGLGGRGRPPKELGAVITLLSNDESFLVPDGLRSLDLTFNGLYRNDFQTRHANEAAEGLSMNETSAVLALTVKRLVVAGEGEKAYRATVEARDFWRMQAAAWERAAMNAGGVDTGSPKE